MRRPLNNLIARFSQSETGATLVEYALLVAFIAMVSFAVIAIIGTETSSVFDSAGKGFSP